MGCPCSHGYGCNHTSLILYMSNPVWPLAAGQSGLEGGLRDGAWTNNRAMRADCRRDKPSTLHRDRLRAHQTGTLPLSACSANPQAITLRGLCPPWPTATGRCRRLLPVQPSHTPSPTFAHSQSNLRALLVQPSCTTTIDVVCCQPICLVAE
jgi:hypothetical protein